MAKKLTGRTSLSIDNAPKPQKMGLLRPAGSSVTTIRLPSDLYEIATSIAATEDRTFNYIANKAISYYCKHYKKILKETDENGEES